jgi:peptidoglycan/xylan/chitin deacetylase (PgdA/CDA1 family)
LGGRGAKDDVCNELVPNKLDSLRRLAVVTDTVLKWTLQRVASGGSILCFHSLTTSEFPSVGVTNIALEDYEALLQLLRRIATIIDLEEMIERHERGMRTRGLVAITFDDAYVNLVALDHNRVFPDKLPATIFVTTQASEAGTRFWWDRIRDLFPYVSDARWRRFVAALGLSEEYRCAQGRKQSAWTLLRQWVLSEHAGRWPESLEPRLRELEEEVGFVTPHRAMTFSELQELAGLPWIKFGVHSVSHPVLPFLGNREIIEEIDKCYHLLKSHFNNVVPIFAFPFGLYDERTETLALEAGMRASVSLAKTTLRSAGPTYPRFVMTKRVRPWDLALRLIGVADHLNGLHASRYPHLPSVSA